MALVRLGLLPGIVEELTRYADNGRYYDADGVRFRSGQPENIGGYQDTSTGNTFNGTARSILVFPDLVGNVNVAIGTNTQLVLWRGGVYNDITPVTASGNLVSPFATTISTSSVQVTHVANGRGVGDTVIFTGSDTFNNITITGSYTVTTLVDADHYTITAATTANATGTGLGSAAVAYQYLLSIGLVDNTLYSGYGTGAYGAGTYGTASPTSTEIDCRTWSLDAWGQDLVACYRPSGVVYQWLGSGNVTDRATAVTNAPSPTDFILVSVPDRHLVAFATDNGGSQDFMNVKWSNQEDRTTWAATATNTAGSQRLNDGTKIIGAARAPGQLLIWTDTALHGMQFIGPPFTFGFHQLGTACGLAGPNAMTVVNGVAYWMGRQSFWMYDGSAHTMPCTLQRTVFSALNQQQLTKIVCGTNPTFNEVWWFYPTTGNEISAYVTYDYVQQIWSKGTLVRTAWNGNNLYGVPLACGSNNKMYYQETGYDADGQVNTTYIESGEMDLGQGDNLLFIDRIIPDFDLTGQVTMTLTARRYPNDTNTEVKGPFTITTSTNFVDTRVRGRQARIRIGSAYLGARWRMGAVRLNLQPDGKR